MAKDLIVYYDKECPFCNSYTKYLKLKSQYNLILKDARVYNDALKVKNIDINKGFVVLFENKSYQGIDALRLLDTLIEDNSLFASCHKIWKNKTIAKILYKIILVLRKALLILKGSETKIK